MEISLEEPKSDRLWVTFKRWAAVAGFQYMPWILAGVWLTLILVIWLGAGAYHKTLRTRECLEALKQPSDGAIIGLLCSER